MNRTFGWDLPPGVTNNDIEENANPKGVDRDEAIAHLRATFQSYDFMVEEYIKEAEHGEGESYWDSFESLEDVVGDFELYKAVEEAG